jgi:hypothetical protein
MKTIRSAALAALVGLLFACGGNKPVPTAARDSSQPEWLVEGSGAFIGDSGKRLQGVGSANASDPKERRQAADAQAKVQLAQTLETFAAQLTRMSESTEGGLGDSVAAIAKKTLDKSQVMDHWVATDGTEQAVAVLDLDTFKTAVRRAEGDGKIKIEMANNAAKAFDAVAKP